MTGRAFVPAAELDLALDRDLARARRLLEEYAAPDRAQDLERARILRFLAEHPLDAHLRSCAQGHLTASALLLDADERQALLTHHRKLDRWLQLGGHADGDANLLAVAVREVREESGIEDLEVLPRPIDVDVHLIPERPARPGRPAEPAHLHLDVRFLLRAPRGAQAIVSEESHELGWFAPGDLGAVALDESVLRLFRLAFPVRTSP